MLKLKLTGWILGNVIHIVCNWSICKLGKMMINTFTCNLKPHYYQRSNAWCGTSMTSAKIWVNRLRFFPSKKSTLNLDSWKKAWKNLGIMYHIEYRCFWNICDITIQKSSMYVYIYIYIYIHTHTQPWPKILAPMVNMIKDGSENLSALLILLIFYLTNSQKI